jgi:hypothetical protein
MQTAKTSLEISQTRWLNALTGRGPIAFLEVPAGAQPLAGRVAAYNRRLFQILTGAQASLAEGAGVQYERQARNVQTGIAEAAKSGPVGSEAAVEALKSMMSATSSRYDSLYKTTCQAVEAAESGMNVVARKTTNEETVPAHAAGGRK